MVPIVVSNIIKVCVAGYHNVLSVEAREGRYTMTGLTGCSSGRPKKRKWVFTLND